MTRKIVSSEQLRGLFLTTCGDLSTKQKVENAFPRMMSFVDSIQAVFVSTVREDPLLFTLKKFTIEEVSMQGDSLCISWEEPLKGLQTWKANDGEHADSEGKLFFVIESASPRRFDAGHPADPADALFFTRFGPHGRQNS